ncbi:MAG: hypothetical protein M1155_00320 [Patescibacteria group bacterium]|nr:hypothetical protein [Patescibacteria group bacterium]
MNNAAIKNRIAWRVYLVWLFKRVIPLFFLELILLTVALWILGRLVFVREVFSNAFLASAQNPFVLAFYMFKAFLTTSLLKKIIILILLGFGVLIIRDVGRMLNSYITTLRITKR